MANETKYDSCVKIKLEPRNKIKPDLKILELGNEIGYHLWFQQVKRDDKIRFITY